MTILEEPRRAEKGLASIAQATLFFVPLLMHPWGQSLCGRIKDVALWTAAAVLGFLLLTLYSSRPSAVALPSRLTRSALPWLAVLLLSVPMAVSRTAAAWGALSVLPVAILAISIAVVARRASGRTRLMRAWLASASLVSLYAIFQHHGISPIAWPTGEPLLRASGTIGAPTFLGSFLALALPFAVPLTRLRRAPIWLTPGVVVIVAALTVTYSRGPWAAAVAGVLVVLYAAPRVAGRVLPGWIRVALGALLCATPIAYLMEYRFFPVVAGTTAMGLAWWAWGCVEDRRFLRIVAVGLVVSAVLVAYDMRRPVSMAADRLTDAAILENDSISSRMGLWRDATQMIMHRPLFGWGADGFRMGASALAHDNAALPKALLYPHQASHNEWYTAAVNGGLPGLLVWTAFLLATMSVVADRSRVIRNGPLGSRLDMERGAVSAAVFGGLVAFVVQGAVTPAAPTTLMGLAMCWGLAAAMEPRSRVLSRIPRPLSRGLAPVWAVGCLMIAVALLTADTLAGSAVRAMRQQRYDDALPAFAAATRWNPMDPDYARAWGEAALRVAGETPAASRETVARQAFAAYQTNISIEHDNGTWHAGAAQALSYYDPKEALSHGRKGVELSPLSSNAWWSLAQAHRANGDSVQAREALLTSIAVGPIVPEPYIRLAEIFRAEGRHDLSNILLTEAADTWKNRDDLAPWRTQAQANAAP